MDSDDSDDEGKCDNCHKLHDDWKEHLERRKEYWKEQYAKVIGELRKSKRDMKDLKQKLTEAGRVAAKQALQKANTPETFDATMDSRVEAWARKDLVRHIKFFTSEEEAADFTVVNSAGYRAIKYFRIQPERAGPWWGKYRNPVERGVNYFRHTTSTMMGKTLKSEFMSVG